MSELDRSRSVADVEGPWVDLNFDSGLVGRLKRNWHVPVHSLSNESLATFIRRRIGLSLVVPETHNRMETGFDDDSELYDGELANALKNLDGAV
jgi:hypothetical protein